MCLHLHKPGDKSLAEAVDLSGGVVEDSWDEGKDFGSGEMEIKSCRGGW
jgi:hypothetical protein